MNSGFFRGGLLHCGFVAGDYLCLGPFVFGVGDAVAAQALDFGEECAEAFEDVVFAEGDFRHHGVYAVIDKGADVKIGIDERGSGLGSDVVQALVHDFADYALDKGVHLAHQGAVHGFRGRFALPCEFYRGGGDLRIGDDSNHRFGIGGELYLRIRCGVLAGRDAAEVFPDL